MADSLKRMQELARKLNEASDAYYGGKGEILTDYEWDAMFDELKKLEESTSIVLPESPTHRVSTDAGEAGQKEAHEFPALSLAKTKKVEDLAKWAEGRPVWMSWKLDGLTLVVTYDGGRLTRVVTRGDGHVGTNITHLARSIRGIPREVAEKGHMVIRGEAVISYADFEKFRLESGEDYANPRNLASGSLTLKDPEEVRKREIHWIPFTLVYLEHPLVSWGERMAYLEKMGFSCVEHEKIENPDLLSLQDAVARWTKKVTDGKNPYPVDGLVLDYDDTDYASTGSVTGHHAARAGYAFKWQDESEQTRLDHIEWSCASSMITPVAVFDPVQLEGTVVRRASLCNISECQRLGIGGKGTVLEVIKANKIIPKVIAVKKKEGELEIPSHCPVCGQKAEVRKSEASGTKTLRCLNPSCPAKKLKKFARFVSKEACNIDGVSEQTLQRFVNEGWIREYADIYRLPEHKGQIAQLDGFGESSEANILASVEKAREVKEEPLLYALNIPLCGRDVAKRLIREYSFAQLKQKAEGAEDPEIFSSIEGIGPEKSASLVRWFSDPQNKAELERLLQQIRLRREEKKEAGERCRGLSFVVTGEVHTYKNREQLKEYIESQGGKVTGSVSRSTSYLINNDPDSPSEKNRKAHQLQIPILSEEEFRQRFA